jgi:endoglucanase
MNARSLLPAALLMATVSGAQTRVQPERLLLNDAGYYERSGVSVMVFDDFYPEGHQGGVTIIQCGRRVAANGDVRLEPTPGQWSPVPKVGSRTIDRERGVIAVTLWYPDSSKNRMGFNPILYPDLAFRYTIRTEPEGDGLRLIVDLEKPFPEKWAHRVGFNLELFPGDLFGEHFVMDGNAGMFPRQANGPFVPDTGGGASIVPLASGKKLVVAPGSEEKEFTIVSSREDLRLIDGRGLYNNGWFVLRSTIPAGAARRAVDWLITPRVKPGWSRAPVVQVSQVGYHPRQGKIAVIELDKRTDALQAVELIRVDQDSQFVVKKVAAPKLWGSFLRYRYIQFDFTDVTREGIYRVKYGNTLSND